MIKPIPGIQYATDVLMGQKPIPPRPLIFRGPDLGFDKLLHDKMGDGKYDRRDKETR